jgi:hypothetical protein
MPPLAFNVPSAVPLTFRSPAHVAPNEPLALVAVWSVTFHLKSVQLLAVGMMFDEDQFPASALMPLAEGPVRVLFRSYPKQPAAASATAQQQTNSVSRFMIVALVCVSGTRIPESRVLGSEKYTSSAYRRARVLASRKSSEA